jgi:BirA family biotin operon repressor/biotin-[acetyl-CoA-carboxylase] ligase
VSLPTQGAAPAPWRLEIHDTLPSTADLCRSRAEAGAADGLAILARRQEHGRGRIGRAWTSPPGNLALSVLLRPSPAQPMPARDAGLWSLLAAVAVADALTPHRPAGTRLALKWPNDVLLDGRKLAGILLDSAATPDAQLSWLSIGIGANLAVAPALPDRPTACLGADAPAPEAFAQGLLARITHWRGIFAAEGFPPVRDAWTARAQPPGTAMTLKLPDREWAGAFAGLDADGSLRLSSGGTVLCFAAGEVVLGG